MNERTKALFAMVDEFNRVHSEWASDPNRPNPDALYWEALDELIAVYRDGDVPEECREMSEAVMALGLEMLVFDNRQDINRQYPHQSFFSAREKLLAIRHGREKRNEPRPLESIDDLNTQKVNPNQIARMHGIETWQVLKYLEKDKEGNRKWDFPTDYVPPHLRDSQERHRSATEKFEAAMTRRDKALAAANPVAPETLEELLAQGVTVRQIARMKRTTETEVVKEAQAKNLTLPKGVNLETINRQSGQLDITQVGVGNAPAPDPQAERPVDVNAEILRLSGQNYTNGEIAAALTISEDQVVRALKALKGPRQRRQVVIPEKEDSPSADRPAEVVA